MSQARSYLSDGFEDARVRCAGGFRPAELSTLQLVFVSEGADSQNCIDGECGEVGVRLFRGATVLFLCEDQVRLNARTLVIPRFCDADNLVDAAQRVDYTATGFLCSMNRHSEIPGQRSVQVGQFVRRTRTNPPRAGRSSVRA